MTNILPLESFRQNYSYHPWHFWQLSSAAWYPLPADCQSLVYGYAWQANDSVGRDDIKRAIASAEGKLGDWLGYHPAPHYVEKMLYPDRWYDARLNRLTYSDASGRWLNVQLPEGKIRVVGKETRTLIGNAALVYSDADGDGLNDTFTATIVTTVTDATQIECMLTSADRLNGEAAGDAWVVAPLTVTIAAGTATIKGRAWQAVKPIKQEPGTAVDPSNAANFITSLDVYRHYCDPTGTTQDTAQAVLIWETAPWPWFAGCCIPPVTTVNSADPAALAYGLARVTVRDAEHGIVGIGEAVYDTASASWQAVSMGNFRPPDRVLIRYYAGDDLSKWSKVIADFGAAELGKRICACNSANRMIYEQQIDRAFGGDARVEKFTMTQGDDQSPFGYKEGQLSAWRVVRNLRQIVGVTA